MKPYNAFECPKSKDGEHRHPIWVLGEERPCIYCGEPAECLACPGTGGAHDMEYNGCRFCGSLGKTEAE